MTQKRKIEDLQAELLDKQKEREDLKAKNQIEKQLCRNLYEQRQFNSKKCF